MSLNNSDHPEVLLSGDEIRKNHPNLLIAFTKMEVFIFLLMSGVCGIIGWVPSSTVIGIWASLLSFSLLCLMWKGFYFISDWFGWRNY
jgi:hypothetical protein